jgi:tetratricopeptide (TPR) repeat protein
MNKDRLKKLLQFLAENPNDSFLHFAIAKEYESLGNEDEALLRFNDLKESDPEYVGTYYHLGKLLERKERLEEAREIYDQGIKVASKAGEQLALSELANAKLNLDTDL